MKKSVLASGAAALVLTLGVSQVVVANQSGADPLPEVTVSVDAPSGSYVNDATHTSVHWKLNHMGLSAYTAGFSQTSIALEFDADNIENSTVSATIPVSSVDTGYPGMDKSFDEEIASDLIMNAAAYPNIEFTSTKLTQTSPTTADIVGDLTMHGVTKPVTLKATYNGSMAEHPFVKVPAIGFKATTTIDRIDFGIDFLSGMGVGDVVDITIQTEFIKS